MPPEAKAPRNVGVVRLHFSVVSSADDRRRNGVKRTRFFASAAAIEITWVLMQERWQNRAANHPAERLVRVGRAVSLGVALRALAISGKGVLPLLGGGKYTSSHKRKWIGDGAQGKLILLPGRQGAASQM